MILFMPKFKKIESQSSVPKKTEPTPDRIISVLFVDRGDGGTMQIMNKLAGKTFDHYSYSPEKMIEKRGKKYLFNIQLSAPSMKVIVMT